ncbi:MAG: 6-bladed beta-propeller [Gemmatimonadota bacterium]|jgi:hypothetical protein
MLLPSLVALMVAPQVAQVQTTLDHEIGSADGGLEEVFGWVSDVAVDADANVYVLDQRSDRIRVFDDAGAYVRTFGRRGGDPGQLNRPIDIDVRGDTVSVLNPSALVNDYSLTGELLTTGRLPFGAQSAIRVADGTYVTLQEGGIARRDPQPIESVLLVGPGITDTVLSVPSRDLLYTGPNATASIGTSLCGLAHAVVGADGELWVASGMDGTLSEWRSENGSFRMGRSAEVAPAGGSLPDALREQVLGELPSQIDATSPDLYVPSMLSSVCGLERSVDGMLWVRLADEDGRERWRAIDAETLSPTMDLTAPAGVALRAFTEGRAVGIRVDEERVPHVGVYRIE